MIKKILILILFFCCNPVLATGYDIFSFGLYDIRKWEESGSQPSEAYDWRYERRFDNSIFAIGPESENFFIAKPFLGIELTSDDAYHIIGGFYLEDNLGTLFTGEESNFIITPSFGGGYYDDGDGKKLGHSIEFRTAIEISYQLVNKTRIGFSLSHTSNANIGDKNPGVETISLSYQIPFN